MQRTVACSVKQTPRSSGMQGKLREPYLGERATARYYDSRMSRASALAVTRARWTRSYAQACALQSPAVGRPSMHRRPRWVHRGDLQRLPRLRRRPEGSGGYITRRIIRPQWIGSLRVATVDPQVAGFCPGRRRAGYDSPRRGTMQMNSNDGESAFSK